MLFWNMLPIDASSLDYFKSGFKDVFKSQTKSLGIFDRENFWELSIEVLNRIRIESGNYLA